MKKHPVALAAKAAIAELTSESATEFFTNTAFQHIGLTVFYIAHAVLHTIEAGKTARSWVSPPVEAKCAGLLSAAPEEKQQAIATLAPVVPIKTNQQKLEDQIIKSIQGKYEQNFQDISGCDESDRSSSDEQCLELAHEPVPPESDTEAGIIPAKAAKTRTTQRSAGQADITKASGRVPRKSGKVSAQ